MANLIIENGADVNAVGKRQATPLHVAAVHGKNVTNIVDFSFIFSELKATEKSVEFCRVFLLIPFRI